ncbi:MAG: molybdopterin molybdotransferase MoeA [Planctomycetota bacterium]|nr:molybdopterin molybdotransferase MoeA [Planctomycetota bacterium]
MTRADPPPSLAYDQALALLIGRTPALEPETVGLADALGRVLREDVLADRDQPPFDRSAMDGYAVRAGDVRPGSALPIVGVAPAGGAEIASPLAPGATVAIATGAPLPPGADAVIPVERSRIDKAAAPARVSFDVAAIKPGDAVHRQASDAAKGQRLLVAGTRLAPQHLGLAAAVGATTLRVTRLPRVVVLSTGDEVRPPETATGDLTPSQIRNSNAPMVLALLRALGCPAVEHRHVMDDPEATLCAAREALSRANLVVTTGGVSVGERDYLPSAWRHLGLETIFHGVNIQPGKPAFAARPAEADDPRLVLGLPGNPVSVLCCAHLYLWPALRKMTGQVMSGDVSVLPWRRVMLANEASPSPKREVFRAARLTPEGAAEVLPWHGSGDLAHTAAAEGWVRLPLQKEPVPAGTGVAFLPMIGA